MYILFIIILYITGGALVPLLPCLTFINLYDETSVNGKGLVKHLKDRIHVNQKLHQNQWEENLKYR